VLVKSARVVLSIVLFAALAAGVGWALGEFVPIGGGPQEPFSDVANAAGARYALYAAIVGAVLGAVYGARSGSSG
jgi:hypothetical protein